jgi:hypothetical protein
MESPMDDVSFWREQAAKFRDRAATTTDAALCAELRELAAICDEVAEEIEDRATAG